MLENRARKNDLTVEVMLRLSVGVRVYKNTNHKNLVTEGHGILFAR